MQDVRTYLMGCANMYVGQSVSSCMANQGTHEVAEYSLLHVHIYNRCSTYVYVYICTHHDRECEVDKIEMQLSPVYTSVAMTTPMGPQC